MKKLYFLPLIAAFAVGCGSKPTEPTNTTPTFSMPLTAANEVPPIVAPDTEATCAGSVTIKLNITRDNAQAITAANADFTANITGCPATTAITIAHIHENVAGQNGGIVVNTGLAGGQVTLVNGAGSFTRNAVQIADLSVVQRMLDNPSGFYFNVHSTAHGGGVIRAQLVRTQ